MMKRVAVLMLAALLLLSPVSASAAGSEDDEPSKGIFGYIFDFIAGIVIPPAGYFTEKVADLSNRVNAKLGGLSYLYQMLKHFFEGLKTPSAASLSLSIPSGFWHNGSAGRSFDLLTSAGPYMAFIRAVSTGLFALYTAMACWRNLRGLFPGGSEGG